MNLDILAIQLANFKQYLNTQELDLEAHGVGLHFLRGDNQVEPRLGSNDAGKSTLWDALTWCLFNKTVGGLRGPDVRSWSTSKPTQVLVTVKIDKDEYDIVRSTNPNKLTINEEDASQEQIDDLIGISFETFCHTVLLGQGKPLFFDLQPKDKLALFSTVLNLDRWEARSSHAATNARQLENKESELQGELIGLETAAEEVEALYDEAQANSTTWVKTNRERKEALEANLEKTRKQLEPIKTKFGAAVLAFDGAATEAKALRPQLEKLEERLQRLNYENDKAINTLEAAERDYRKVKQQLDSLNTAKVCPTCGQDVKPANLAKHKRELERELKKLKQVIDIGIPVELTEELTTKNDEVGRLKAALREFDTKVDKALAEQNMHRPNIAQLEAQILSLERSLSLSDEEANPYREQLVTLRQRKKDIAKDIKSCQEDIDKVGRILNRTKYWVKGFKDVRLFIIDEVLQELGLVTNSLLVDVGLEDWSVEYSVEKETKSGTTQRGLNVTILSPHNDKPVRWESWGGGVGQRLRLIGSLALAEVLLAAAGLQIGLEVLDEPTRHLSPEGVRDVCNFLAARAASLEKQIWYIDHAARESSDFTSVVTIVKTAKGAQIKEVD